MACQKKLHQYQSQFLKMLVFFRSLGSLLPFLQGHFYFQKSHGMCLAFGYSVVFSRISCWWEKVLSSSLFGQHLYALYSPFYKRTQNSVGCASHLSFKNFVFVIYQTLALFCLLQLETECFGITFSRVSTF